MEHAPEADFFFKTVDVKFTAKDGIHLILVIVFVNVDFVFSAL